MLLSRIVILLFYIAARPVLAIETNSSSAKLWTNLMRDCDSNASITCVQNNVYRYFADALDSKDLEVANFLKFTKNDLKYVKGDKDEEFTGRSSPIEEVSDALRDKASEFMLTHDVELALPDFLFGGAVMRISPRSLEGSGALLKVDFETRQAKEESTPRIFLKKIKKFFGGKLAMALMAIVLIIKLIATKLMFFLPAIMGVAAAKKLLLKVLLFVFPAISYLFKLCPYYSPTKYHHHHHQISHLHQIPHLHGGIHSGIELDHPPPGWNEHQHEHHEDGGYYSDGASFSADFSSHRKNLELGKPVRRDEATNAAAAAYGENGQGQPGLGHRIHESTKPAKLKPGPLTPTEIENMVLKAEKEAMLKSRLQEEHQRVEIENKKLQEQIKASLKIQEKLKIQSLVAKQTNKIAAVYQQQQPVQSHLMQPHIVHAIPGGGLQPHAYIQSPQVIQHVPHHTQAIYQQNIQPITQATPIYQAPAIPSPSPSPPLEDTDYFPVYDSFYSPILDKIDTILEQLGFQEEGCRERLICSMYKNPTQYSPHSNLISAELSRDVSELQKPTSSNTAVIRFYKYVQAARDGQDKRECLRLYPSCSVVTE